MCCVVQRDIHDWIVFVFTKFFFDIQKDQSLNPLMFIFYSLRIQTLSFCKLNKNIVKKLTNHVSLLNKMCPCWVKRRLGEFAQTNCAGCCCVKSCFSHLRQEKMRFKHSTKTTGVGTRRNPSENQFLRRKTNSYVGTRRIFFFRFFLPRNVFFAPKCFFCIFLLRNHYFTQCFNKNLKNGYSEC